MAIQLKTNSGQVDLTAKLAKGEDGGYYIPNINADGILSWTPSEDDMPEIPTRTNIIGPAGEQGLQGEPGIQGEPGESGVYVGTEEPTDDEMLIWINPEGEASTGLATIEYVDNAIKSVPGADLTGYATEKYVDDAVAAINIPSLDGYATEQYVTDAIAAIDIPETDLTNYYTKEEVDNKIPSLEGYALKTDIPDVTAFQTEEQVNALIAASIGEIENGTY